MTREEQLDWLCRLRSEVKIYMPREWIDHFEDALTESINTLSQEPKTGRWIELPKAFDTNENPCKCSACGHILSFMHSYPKSNFCPQCGAKMERDET